jgi:hypothetical protein
MDANDMLKKGLIYTIVMNVGVKLIIFEHFSRIFDGDFIPVVGKTTKILHKTPQIDLIS